MSLFGLTAMAFVLWVVGGAIYRLFFSPLAQFPGRKIAILTAWYEAYYQIVKRGRYPWEIQKMHEQYGMSMTKESKGTVPQLMRVV